MVGPDVFRRTRAADRDIDRCRAAHAGNLAFDIADARFASVVSDQFHQGSILDDQLVMLESVLEELLGQQMISCDLELFVFRVAG